LPGKSSFPTRRLAKEIIDNKKPAVVDTLQFFDYQFSIGRAGTCTLPGTGYSKKAIKSGNPGSMYQINHLHGPGNDKVRVLKYFCGRCRSV